MALRALEILGIVVFVILVITQIVVPLWGGRRLFPLFRGRDSEKRLVAAHERVEDAELTRVAEDLERQAESSAASGATKNLLPQTPHTTPHSAAPNATEQSGSKRRKRS